MTDHPDLRPHIRYEVSLRNISGATKTVSVITNRGELKAVFLAAAGTRRLFGGWDALDIVVRVIGDPELDSDGVPILEGSAFDRNEW